MKPDSTPTPAVATPGVSLAPYRHYLIALALWLVGTGPAWYTMAVVWWNDSNYSHGLLIIPVAIFFLWRGRKRWLEIEPQISWTGVVCFVGVALIYLAGTAAAENFSVRVAAVAGVGTLTWALLGGSFLRRVWFPAVLLFFAVPLPYIIYYRVTFPMQLFSTRAACGVLKLLGMTFVREGNVIHLPGVTLEVVEACSGVRSLLSLTTLGAAYAYLTQPGYWRPWLLFALSVPIALGANVVRLTVTAVGAYAWDPRIAQDFLHEFSGLLVFAVALIALFICGAILGWIGKKLQR